MSKVTIKDIAKYYGVSTTTVSNALNGKPGVGKTVRRRIIKTAKEMGYQPNYFAKGLVSKQSYAIGLTISNISDPYASELARGAFDKASDLGYSLMLFNTNYIPDNETKCIETLISKDVDGILLATATQDDPNIERLEEFGKPYVLVSRLILDPKIANRIDSVSMDTYGGFYQAARHICRIGHTNIAMIAGDMDTSTAITLTNGAMDAFQEYGISIPPEMIVECGFARQRAYEAAKKLLSAKKRPKAILIQGDNMALGVREAIFETGLRIPEDVAIIGFDNINISSLTGIDLTTVSTNTYKMGVNSVQLLVDKIKSGDKSSGGVSSKMVMEAELVIRKTCGYHLKGYVKD